MKSEHDIETLLRAERQPCLGADDKESIKQRLLAEATRTLPTTPIRILSPWTGWFVRASVSVVAVLMVVVGTTYASYDSLPGEPLYHMKVHIVEEIAAMTKLDPEARIQYDTMLLERRYEELLALSRVEAASTSLDLSVFTDQVNEHVTNVVETYEQATEADVDYPERIRSLTKISGLVKAQTEHVTELSGEAAAVDELAAAYETATQAITDEAILFVESAPAEEVQSYLSEQVEEITDVLIGIGSSTDDVLSETVESLTDIDVSLQEGDLVEAVVTAAEAQAAFTSDAYEIGLTAQE